MQLRATTGWDAGQATPLVIGVIGLAVTVALALGPLTRHAHDRARARTAADAAALAGAAEGEAVARSVAIANGARVLFWREEGSDVWIGVELGEARAAAKARRE